MTAQEIIALVHRHDELVEERVRLVKDLDLQIAAIKAQLDGIGQPTNGHANGRPHGLRTVADGVGRAADSTPKTARIIEMIERTPTLDYGEACVVVYGEDTPAIRKRLRSMLSSLVTGHRIKNVGRNTWEVLG